MKKEFFHKNLTREILGAAFEVHNTLGCGFLEKVYENSLIEELSQRGIRCKSQVEIEISYKNKPVGIYVADILVEDKVIIEVKACEKIDNIHKAQLINYLKATGYKVGLLLNFAKTRLEYKRIVVS